jgi:hypothetical protein
MGLAAVNDGNPNRVFEQNFPTPPRFFIKTRTDEYQMPLFTSQNFEQFG